MKRLTITYFFAACLPGIVNAQNKIATWTLAPAYTVGEAGTIELARPNSLQLTRDGRLYISDGGAKNVFVVDKQGKALAPLGRTGSGPGEYRSPKALATIGDTIAVLDPGNSRIDLFNSAGTSQGNWLTQNIDGDETVRLYRVPGEVFYAVGNKMIGNRATQTYIQYSRKGVGDTLIYPPFTAATQTGLVCQDGNGSLAMFSSRLLAKRIVGPGPGVSLLEANASTYRIEQKNGATGAIVMSYGGPPTAVPITDVEWEKAGEEVATYLKRNPKAECNPRGFVRPSSKPSIRAFWWDDSGRLWVERFIANGFSFDVFTQKGVMIATMAAPERDVTVEPTVVGNRLAMAGVNADGIPVVRVYTVNMR